LSSSKDKKNNVLSSIPQSAFEEALRAVESIEKKQKKFKGKRGAGSKGKITSFKEKFVNIENDAEDLDSLLNLLESKSDTTEIKLPDKSAPKDKSPNVPTELTDINGLIDEELNLKEEADFFRDILFNGSKEKGSGKRAEKVKRDIKTPTGQGIKEQSDKFSPEMESELKDLKEQLVRLQADFENYRKRVTREVEEGKKYYNENLILDILPIVDNFERAIEHMQEPSGQQSLVEGVHLIFRQIIGMLQQKGLRTIDSFEQKFNPLYHEAVSMIYNPEVEPGTIIAEYETGYLLNGRLLRPSKVLVASTENGNGIGSEFNGAESNNEVDEKGDPTTDENAQ